MIGKVKSFKYKEGETDRLTQHKTSNKPQIICNSLTKLGAILITECKKFVKVKLKEEDTWTKELTQSK